MRHGILGAGGVGGLLGAVLAKAGESVKVIVRPATLHHHPRRLSLDSKFGGFSVPVDVVSSADGPLDILWITVKATQLEAALDGVPIGSPIPAVVPLLNGIDHIEMLRLRFGHDRVVAATIAVESERIAPGEIVHRSPFARMNIAASGRERLEPAVRQLREFGFECSFVEDEATMMWSKLVFLAPIALSTTVADNSIGEVIANPVWKGLLEVLVREASAVAAANEAIVNPDKVIEIIKSLPPETRSSMQKDLKGGRMPELNAIAGPILRGAEAHRLDAGTTQKLVRTIEAKLKLKPRTAAT